MRDIGGFAEHLNYVRQVIGLREGVRTLGTMNMVILGGRPLFMCDTYVNFDPSPEQLAELTLLAAEEVRRFGLAPSVALLSHSSFGSADSPSAGKMRAALALIQQQAPDLAVEGRDARRCRAVESGARSGLPRLAPEAEEANLLIMPKSGRRPTSPSTCCGWRPAAASPWADPARCRQVRSYSDADRDGPRHPQHDGAGGRRCGADQRACAAPNGGGVTLSDAGSSNGHMVSETSDLHRVIVVGGGAGGLELVTRLGNKLGRRKRPT